PPTPHTPPRRSSELPPPVATDVFPRRAGAPAYRFRAGSARGCAMPAAGVLKDQTKKAPCFAQGALSFSVRLHFGPEAVDDRRHVAQVLDPLHPLHHVVRHVDGGVLPELLVVVLPGRPVGRRVLVR